MRTKSAGRFGDWFRPDTSSVDSMNEANISSDFGCGSTGSESRQLSPPRGGLISGTTTGSKRTFAVRRGLVSASAEARYSTRQIDNSIEEKFEISASAHQRLSARAERSDCTT